MLVKHTLARQKRQFRMTKKTHLPPKETCKLIMSLSGIMFLLGLTWILLLLTSVSADSNINAAFSLRLLFVIFNSLQGFFIFIFFVVFNADARSVWQSTLCPCHKQKREQTTKSYPRYTNDTSTTKRKTSSTFAYASSTLELAVKENELISNPQSIGVISEVDGETSSCSTPDIYNEYSSIEKRDNFEMQPKESLTINNSNVIAKARVRRVSTKKRTHHIETAEIDFTECSDDSDQETLI